MRREYFDLSVHNTAWVGSERVPEKPVLDIGFDGPPETLERRLLGSEERSLDADETDVAYRFHDESEASERSGVLAVTNRVTGDFVIELDADPGEVLRFVRAARAYQEARSEDTQYRIVLRIGEREVFANEKSILLVYAADGSLRREDSLIPAGVEL